MYIFYMNCICFQSHFVMVTSLAFSSGVLLNSLRKKKTQTIVRPNICDVEAHSPSTPFFMKKKTQNPEQHWDCFNMGVLTEISQSLWSCGVLYTLTNVQILPVVTMCQLKPALTVLFTSEKMVERTGEGTDRCNSQGGSAVLYCIRSHCAATTAHLSDSTSANILTYLPLEFLKLLDILLPPQF